MVGIKTYSNNFPNISKITMKILAASPPTKRETRPLMFIGTNRSPSFFEYNRVAQMDETPITLGNAHE
jgi:hypothetical protein